MPATPWSPQQRYWLQALGHTVYREAGAEPEPVAPVAAAAAMPAMDAIDAREAMPPRPRPSADRDIAPRRAPPALDEAPAAASPAPAAAPRAAGGRRPSGLPDRLQLALLRASGLDPSDPAAQAAMAQWPVQQLRGDAAAKRAFWPQLRALRRRP